MPYVTYARRKELDDARLRVAIVLTSAGEPMAGTESMRTLMGACKRLFFPWMSGEDTVDYFNRVCESAARAKDRYCGEVVQPFVVNLMKRDKIEASRLPTGNPRMDDMDSLPHQISMPWDGKGAYWRQHGDTDHFGKGERR